MVANRNSPLVNMWRIRLDCEVHSLKVSILHPSSKNSGITLKAGPERLYQAKAVIHYSKMMFAEQNRAVTQDMHKIKPEKNFKL